MARKLKVEPIAFESGRFFVASQSRQGLKHVVDLSFLAEGERTPKACCSCEGKEYKRTKYCRHIRAAVAFETKRLKIKD